MAIILAEAAIDESGQTGYEGSKPGDQTNNECRRINYYNYRTGWKHVFRWKSSTIAKRFAVRMAGAVDNPCIGYSQPKRYTYWDCLKAASYDPVKISTSCEVDCSALVCANVNAALLEAGINHNISPFEYTASMAKAFANDSNFEDVISKINLSTGDGLEVGDILLGAAQTHTAAVIIVDEKLNMAPKWVAECISNVTVYADEAATKKCEYPALAPTNLVDVCDAVGNYYYIRIAAKYYGFAVKSAFKEHTDSTKNGKTTTSVNMRSSATKYASIITVVPANTTVVISDQKTDTRGVVWYKVTYNGAIGWCSSTAIAI